jgi:hypothetical protein
MSRRGAIGFLQGVEGTESVDYGFAGIGEVLERFHDGCAEPPPIGGRGVLGGE